MKPWPFSIFQRRTPRLAELPKSLAAAAVLGGAFAGIASLITEAWLGNFSRLAILHSTGIGAIFAVSFYASCALPQGFLTRVLAGYPASIARTIRVLAGAVISLIISVFERLRSDVRRAEARAHQNAVATAKAQAAALQAQINPHFFFNTLNTVSALIAIDPPAAQEMIGRMADMFRYTLACSTADLVSLDQELGFVENYLKVEQARFQERLTVDLPPRAGLGLIALPGLTLQPLVENAIRHGVSQRVEGGSVRILVESNGTSCRVRVRNQFASANGLPDLRPERVFRAGHALANVRDRLALAHGSLDITMDGEEWVQVTLTLPVGKQS